MRHPMRASALFLVFKPGTEDVSIADGVFDPQSVYAVSNVYRRCYSKAIRAHRCSSGKQVGVFEAKALAVSVYDGM